MQQIAKLYNRKVAKVRILYSPQLKHTLDGAHKDSVQSVHNPSTEGLSPNSSIGRALLMKSRGCRFDSDVGDKFKINSMKDNKEAKKENSFEDTVIAVCIVGIFAILIIAAVANRIGML